MKQQETEYKMYNPYDHLTGKFFLTVSEWERVKAQLSEMDLYNIEHGGSATVGAAAVVWKSKH